jgi:AcrR family transcriptional regulator
MSNKGLYSGLMSNDSDATRLSPEHRREQILRVAATHFARAGLQPISVQAIARDAGVTRALVYHYFPGKEALLEGVLRQEATALLAATAPVPGLSPAANLERSLGAYLDHFAASGGRLRDFYAPLASSPEIVRRLAQDNHAVQIERILAALELDAMPATRLAIGAWLGFVVEAARTAASAPGVTRAELIGLCMRALHAVVPPPVPAPSRTNPSRKEKHR